WLGLPAGRTTLLSVGALNFSEKRMDYLIREVKSLPEPRPFLAMVGAHEPESDPLLELAASELGHEGFVARPVAQSEMADWYHAADVFALASLSEGFCLALAEALGHGLPAIAHEFPTTSFVAGDDAYLTDLTRPGALAEGLERIDHSREAALRRRRRAYERF